jgi:hypothetical protein
MLARHSCMPPHMLLPAYVHTLTICWGIPHILQGLFGVQFGWGLYCWSGRRIHDKLGIAVPSWYPMIEKSPLTPIMVVYYISNMLQDRIIASGSFDVAVNNKAVWSTAEKGRVPSWQELLWQLEEAGLPRISGADDAANWPVAWQDTKAAEPPVHGEI